MSSAIGVMNTPKPIMVPEATVVTMKQAASITQPKKKRRLAGSEAGALAAEVINVSLTCAASLIDRLTAKLC
jgi:hypothetical protein